MKKKSYEHVINKLSTCIFHFVDIVDNSINSINMKIDQFFKAAKSKKNKIST